LSKARAGDAVLFTYSEEKRAFDEYQWRLRATGAPIHEYPEDTEAELLMRRPSRLNPELLDGIKTGCRRIWVVSAFRSDRLSRQVAATLSAHFPVHENFALGFVREEVFADPAVPSSDEHPVAEHPVNDGLCH